MSIQQERIDRADALVQLINALPGSEFAANAACTDEDPELFFPISGDDTERIAAAKVVCESCPIRAACLQFALRTGEDHGIWGGLTAGERRRVRVLRRDTDEGTEGVAA